MLSGIGMRTVQARDPAWRLRITATAAALVAVSGIVAAVVVAPPAAGQRSAAQSDAGRAAAPPTQRPAPHTQPQDRTQPQTALTQAKAVVDGTAQLAQDITSHGAWLLGPLQGPLQSAAARTAAVPLVLTAADHRQCPASATACVDLTRHITWLQAKGAITFGPVHMEPGNPASAHQTPRGTFHVSWKAGPNFVSNIYHEAMPWATFFAAGGIAFHGGSLTQWSHGCVHLTVGNAHYYQDHLPIGAEVVVF
jgi:lipoprotein-anchoring transpeptidase ErfK/SrfK